MVNFDSDVDVKANAEVNCEQCIKFLLERASTVLFLKTIRVQRTNSCLHSLKGATQNVLGAHRKHPNDRFAVDRRGEGGRNNRHPSTNVNKIQQESFNNVWKNQILRSLTLTGTNFVTVNISTSLWTHSLTANLVLRARHSPGPISSEFLPRTRLVDCAYWAGDGKQPRHDPCRRQRSKRDVQTGSRYDHTIYYQLIIIH